MQKLQINKLVDGTRHFSGNMGHRILDVVLHELQNVLEMYDLYVGRAYQFLQVTGFCNENPFETASQKTSVHR